MNENLHLKISLLLILISLLLFLKDYVKHLMTKTKTTFANISSKRINPRVSASPRSPVQYFNEYLVEFKLEDGTTIEFSFPEEQYFTLIEGTNGKITYKGYKLISFEAE